MSKAPTHRITELQGEIRELERSRRALEDGLAAVEQGEQRTKEGLKAVRERIIASAHAAVPDPDDRAIPLRIAAAVRSVCAATGRALTERWTEIRNVLKKALEGVTKELDGKKRELRRREGELLLGRNAASRDGAWGGPGSTGGSGNGFYGGP